jgi:hypothetical protein
MHTFSCAVQSVDVDGVILRFEADPQDYHICRLYLGDQWVVTFDRNGIVASVARIEPEPAPDQAEPDPVAADPGTDIVGNDKAD